MSVFAQANIEEVEGESRNTEPLFGRTVGAFAWRFISESSRLVLQLAVMVVLARLLPVEAFGLMALAMLVINIASRISNIGMSSALIQIPGLTETHVRVVFTISALTGVILATLVWAGAPLLAALLGTKEAIPVFRLISVYFLSNSLGDTALALLQRNLDYRSLLRVELLSYALGYVLVSIGLAILDYGAWSLAWGTIVHSILRTILLYIASPHSIRPSLAASQSRQLLNFGVGQSLSIIANTIAVNGDYFVVGRWLGTTALGLYSRAYQLMALPMYQFSSVISSVLFPVYSIIQNDTPRLRRAYFTSITVSSVVVCPILAGLAIAAPEIMSGVFGPEWADAATPLEILCIGGIFMSMSNLGDSLARAKGAVYLKFYCHSVYAICVFLGSYVGSRWGINGVAIGVAISLTLIYVLMAKLSLRLTQSSWKQFFLFQLPGAILAIAVVGLTLPITLLMRAAKLPYLVTLAGTLFVSLVAVIIAGLLLLRNSWVNKSVLRAVNIDKQRIFYYVKNLLRQNERAFNTIEILYDNLLFLPEVSRRELKRFTQGFRRSKYYRVNSQVVMTWNVAFPRCDSPAEFISWLRSRGIQVHEGGQTFYIPPQEALIKFIPEIVGFYPPGSGFKILKDLKHPAQAKYVSKDPYSFFLLNRLIGAPQKLLVPANYMYSLGIGPRVWDLSCWETQGAYYTVFVVDHVSGGFASVEQCVSFLEHLKQLNRNTHLRILIPNWEQNEDFMPPDCHGNLIFSHKMGRTQYIDFQNFSLNSSNVWVKEVISSTNGAFHFSNRGSAQKEKRQVYTTAEDYSRKQWPLITSALREASLSLTGRIILDIGCNSGLTLHTSLAKGAAWGFGWDHPDTLEHTQNLLLSLGSTRFSLTGAHLHSGYQIVKDIPDRFQSRLAESVMFYRSAREHIDVLESLCRTPWRLLVYEGAGSEHLDDFPRLLKSIPVDNLKVISSSYLVDSNSCRRPVTIFLRN